MEEVRPMPGQFHERFQIASGGSNDQLLAVNRHETNLHIPRGSDFPEDINRHQLAPVYHANDTVPTTASHRLVGGEEHRGMVELLSSVAQFVNADFGASDGVQ